MFSLLYCVFDAVGFFGGFGVVPAAHIAHKIACDAADALKLLRQKLILKIDKLAVELDIEILEHLAGMAFLYVSDIGVNFLLLKLSTDDFYIYHRFFLHI